MERSCLGRGKHTQVFWCSSYGASINQAKFVGTVFKRLLGEDRVKEG
jgi:hypothetical protein